MTKIETDLKLMLLKLCEDVLPRTALAGDEKITSALKKVRQHLQDQKSSPRQAGATK